MPKPVKDRQAMIAGMSPVLDPETWYFCPCDKRREGAFQPRALASFREDEGMSLILDEAAAMALGAKLDHPMRRIVLTVHSALDGVGLTVAVAEVLAREGIPCNMVAALRHDHVFVPAGQAAVALSALKALSASAQEASA